MSRDTLSTLPTESSCEERRSGSAAHESSAAQGTLPGGPARLERRQVRKQLQRRRERRLPRRPGGIRPRPGARCLPPKARASTC